MRTSDSGEVNGSLGAPEGVSAQRGCFPKLLLRVAARNFCLASALQLSVKSKAETEFERQT